MQRIKKLDIKKLVAPPDAYVSYDITMNCNMRCEYCYVLDKLDNKKKGNLFIQGMVLRKFERFLKKYKDLSVEFDVLGGEPLLFKGLRAFVEKLIVLQNKYSNFKLITITTNATVLNNDILNLDYNPKIHFVISYHNSIKSIDKLKTNLIAFGKITDYVTLTILLFKKDINISNILLLLKFCDEHNINTTSIDVNDGGDGFEFVDKELYKLITSKTSNYKDIKRYPFNGEMVSMKEIHDNNWYIEKDVICTMACFNIDYEGNIHAECNYQLPHANIKTSDININKLHCVNTSCMGETGLNQKKIECKML